MADFTLRGTPQYRQAMSESVRAARARMRAETNANRIKPTGEVILPGGFVCWVDPADVPLVSGRVWHAHKTHGKVYARSGHRGSVFMHALIMGVRPGMKVDHKDGDGLNNCRSNLRWATQSQNCVNTTKLTRSTSGYRGVSRTRTGHYHASINVDKRRFNLGNYSPAVPFDRLPEPPR